MEKEALLTSIKEAILQIEPEATVILFGSRARGDEREESDWDILILTPQAIDSNGEQKFRCKLFDLELEYEQAISTFALSKTEWESKHFITPFYQSVKSDGIEL